MKNSSRLISMGAAGVVRRFCTAMKAEIKPKPMEESTTLYQRLVGLTRTGGGVAETVNNYLSEGNEISESVLRGCVKGLRKFNHSPQAFELMQWMEKRGSDFSGGDYAVYIDLLTKVKGVGPAEEYFDKLSPSFQNNQTYGSLLSCFCRQKMREKALALFEKMSELNVASSSLNYNNLMSLYMKLGEPEKVLPLVQEMKEKNIPLDTCTYNIWISSYTSLKDISEAERVDGAERVVKEMEREDGHKCDSSTYSSLAVTYIDAGLYENAEMVLKKLEKTITVGGRDRTPYHMLISLYARTANLSEVHRVWNKLKSSFSVAINTSYLLMLEALNKLADIDGLTKCYQEWELGCSHYDPRLTNVLLRAYLKRGMISEAKVLCENAIKRGSGLPYTTYEIFVDFFLRNRQSSMALRCFELGLSKVKAGKWKACRERVISFLKLFEEEKDDAGAENFHEMLERTGNLNSEVRNLLLYSHVGRKQEPETDQKMKVDEFVMTSEVMELVERICPQ